MDEMLFTSVIFLIIICFLGHLIINYWFSEPLREGARTLPRPHIGPMNDKISYKFKPSPPYFGETLNQLIDRYINKYFDRRGIPYTNTIQLYIENCVDKGNVSEKNKRKLNDIGYYLLNIVIPNIQSVKSPRPDVYWPPIKWSDLSTFDVLIQPTPTYLVYKGQPYSDSYTANYNSSASNGQGGLLIDSGNNRSNSSDNSSSDIIPGDSDCSLTTRPGGRGLDCGIGCPTSCLAGVMAAWDDAENKNKSPDSSDESNSISFSDIINGTHGGANNANIGNVQKLPDASNTVIIGSAEIDGYAITDEEQTSTETTLNNSIDSFIDEFFIKTGPNKNKPTKKAIEMFNMYFQYKKPMDDIRMNKMRDVVYYILQVIIPGLPTSTLPRSYVEWRPIVWLSLSERNR
jgi:hypothetical protein